MIVRMMGIRSMIVLLVGYVQTYAMENYKTVKITKIKVSDKVFKIFNTHQAYSMYY